MGEAGGIPLYVYCANESLDHWDYLGKWKDHDVLTIIAWKLALKFMPESFNSKCPNTILKKLIAANKSVDSEDKWNDNHWHFNRNTGECAECAIKRYTELLQDNWKEMIALMESPSKNNCDDALNHLGWLSHAWQDYYAHAIAMNSDGWTDIGKITGAPDELDTGVKPSSWDNWWWSTGEHGGLFGGLTGNWYDDPAFRAPDTKPRRDGAILFTLYEFDKILPEWWSKCHCEACK